MKKRFALVALIAAAPLSAQQPATPQRTAPALVAPAATTAPTPAPAPTQAPATSSAPPPAQSGMTTGAGAITPSPAASATDVAAIIAREFPAYDKNRDGALTTPEFNDWMLKLKTIADPTLRADAPATRTWLGAAFLQADLDKSRGVTLPELTGFLTPARS